MKSLWREVASRSQPASETTPRYAMKSIIANITTSENEKNNEEV